MAGNEVILLNRGCMGEPYVIENVCFVGSDESVDITIEQGRIADVRSSEKSVDKASKTWVIPGLWDCHTHFTQWSYTLGYGYPHQKKKGAVIHLSTVCRKPVGSAATFPLLWRYGQWSTIFGKPRTAEDKNHRTMSRSAEAHRKAAGVRA